MEKTIVGVRFQEAGKIYYFEPGGYEDTVEVGSNVVVETSRGVELGRVVIAPGQVLAAELTEPLKPIIRPATSEDVDRADALREKAREATELARQRARALDLPMKIVSAQYTLDGSRVTVFFTAEDRVDFRDLVRDLSQQMRVQVQLRQVGPRDQAKLIGGYGRCGRRLCCTSWLTAFPSISIKMAKEQNLPLNPSKISGQCGRLLCCLSYENDLYKQLRAELPRPDSWVSTPSGDARVVSVNAIKQIVMLQMSDLKVIEFTVAQLSLEQGVVRFLPNGPRVPPPEVHERPSSIERTAGIADAEVHPPIMRPPGDRGAPRPDPRPSGRGPDRSPNRGQQPPRTQPNQPRDPEPRPAIARADQDTRDQGRDRSQVGNAPAAANLQPPQPDLTTEPRQPAPPAQESETAQSKHRRRHRRGKRSE